MSLGKDKLEDMDISLHFSCRPHGANTSNFNKSLTVQYFWELLSAYENLGYLWLFPVGFINFHQIVFKWEHFEKKVFKDLFSPKGKNSDFWKKSQKVLDFDKALPPTHSTYNKSKGIYERWYPYHSYDTLRFEICPTVGSQWPRENHGHMWADAKSEWYVHIL